MLMLITITPLPPLFAADYYAAAFAAATLLR